MSGKKIQCQEQDVKALLTTVVLPQPVSPTNRPVLAYGHNFPTTPTNAATALCRQNSTTTTTRRRRRRRRRRRKKKNPPLGFLSVPAMLLDRPRRFDRLHPHGGTCLPLPRLPLPRLPPPVRRIESRDDVPSIVATRCWFARSTTPTRPSPKPHGPGSREHRKNSR